MRGRKFLVSGVEIDSNKVSKIRIYQTKVLSTKLMGTRVWDVGRDVTRYFISSLPTKDSKPKPSTKNVFIVHGRDHKPMKELKAMLKEFKSNPIVLHEQPSGSRTIVEKLEKYSDVGYAFVILTPDDLGHLHDEFKKAKTSILLKEILKAIEGKQKVGNEAEILTKIFKMMEKRARQNVILEFGYFIGLLGRDKVCCLYKGDVELPSDMQGIVYIPFNKSVSEVRDKIVKELSARAAGYEIKIK